MAALLLDRQGLQRLLGRMYAPIPAPALAPANCSIVARAPLGTPVTTLTVPLLTAPRASRWPHTGPVRACGLFAVEPRASRPDLMRGLTAAPVLGPVDKFPAETP